MRASRARLHLFLAVLLTLLTLLAPLVLILPRTPCRLRAHAHAALLAGVRAVPPPPADASAHAAIRRLSTAFLARSRHATCAPVQLSGRTRRRVEHAPHGALLYVLGVVGARSRIGVEVAGRRGVSAGALDVLALRHGWVVIALHETWAGYEAARTGYEGKEARKAMSGFPGAGAVAVEAGRVAEVGLAGALRAVSVGGKVDVVVVFGGGGDDVAVMQRLGGVRPRVLVMRYEDYWGAEVKTVRSSAGYGRTGRAGRVGARLDGGEREVEYVGASIAALVEAAAREGFRLVWCTAKEAVAFFVDERTQVGDGVLPTVSAKECMGERRGKKWRRDMEAAWDAAQLFHWRRFN